MIYFAWSLLLVLIVFLVLFQMLINLLSEIHKDSRQWTICVLVSRMWHYRGGTDEGPIKHTDLVLIDEQVGATLALFFLLPCFALYQSCSCCVFL
jgi:hypothetical protein